MKNRLQLIRTRPKIHTISDNPNVSSGILDCSLYTHRTALKDDYHDKGMDMLAYTPVAFKRLESLSNTFIIHARQKQFIQENNAPVRRIDSARKTNYAFTESYNKNPFWYQYFDRRQVKIIRSGQQTIDFERYDIEYDNHINELPRYYPRISK